MADHWISKRCYFVECVLKHLNQACDYNLHKNQNIPAPFTSKCSGLRICEQLNKGKPRAAVPVICATKHLLLSRGLSGRPPALCSSIHPGRACIFRHDMPLSCVSPQTSRMVSSSIFVNSVKVLLLGNNTLPEHSQPHRLISILKVAARISVPQPV